MFVIYDKEIPTIIYGIASTREKAETAKERIVKNAMTDMLAVDPIESGIRWEDWSEGRKAALWQETAEIIGITEKETNVIQSSDGEEFYV